MIFVTVGEQTPFDRLVRCVDDWAGEQEKAEVFAQIGHTEFVPRHIQWTQRLDPDEFKRMLVRAEVVIAHAGMGTILSALEAAVSLLVMPRSAALRETRNDHQLGTVRTLKARGMARVAQDEVELRSMLDRLEDLPLHPAIESTASEPLVKTLREFIERSRTHPKS